MITPTTLSTNGDVDTVDQAAVHVAVPTTVTFHGFDLYCSQIALIMLAVANGYELPRVIATYDEGEEQFTVTVAEPTIAAQLKDIVERVVPIERPEQWLAYARSSSTFDNKALEELFKWELDKLDRKTMKRLWNLAECAIQVVEDTDEQG